MKLKSDTSPIFLIGHLRSGTSFMHRFMLDNCHYLNGKKMEDMVFNLPVLSLCPFLKPLLRKISFDSIYPPHIHKTSLRDWETDDIAFSLRYRAGHLSWLYFNCRQKLFITETDYEEWVQNREDKILSCWFKLYAKDLDNITSGRILSKSFILLFFIDELLEIFPQARFIVMSRSPLNVIPSTLSLMQNVQHRAFYLKELDRSGKRFYHKNVYTTIKCYYRMLNKIIMRKDLKDNVIFIQYDKCMNDFENEFLRLSDFCNIEVNKLLLETVKKQAEIQKNRESHHHYTCDDFGISENNIIEDFNFDNKID